MMWTLQGAWPISHRNLEAHASTDHSIEMLEIAHEGMSATAQD